MSISLLFFRIDVMCPGCVLHILSCPTVSDAVDIFFVPCSEMSLSLPRNLLRQLNLNVYIPVCTCNPPVVLQIIYFVYSTVHYA
jgi:hypothetical protein